MTTQPQSPVTVMPPLPNRRNAELFLLGFATVLTTVALLLVEANQEQGLHWDLAQYAVAYLALFAAAHLTIRRFTPYADGRCRTPSDHAVRQLSGTGVGSVPSTSL